jgi:hypothetical protein
MPSKPSVPPLAKSVAPEAPSWDDVDPLRVPEGRDTLGLSHQDRIALGLSPGMEMTHFHTGDSTEALVAALQHGGAIGPPRKPRRL